MMAIAASADQGQARSEAINAIDHVCGVDAAGDGENCHRQGEPAELKDAESRQQLTEVNQHYACSRRHDQGGGDLHGEAQTVRQLEMVVGGAKRNQGDTAQEHMGIPGVGAVERYPQRKEDREDGDAADQRHLALMMLTFIRVVHPPPAKGQRTHGNGEGQGRDEGDQCLESEGYGA